MTERVLDTPRGVAAAAHAQRGRGARRHAAGARRRKAAVVAGRRGERPTRSRSASRSPTLLGADAERPLAAWREVAARARASRPSESLALAERELAR